MEKENRRYMRQGWGCRPLLLHKHRLGLFTLAPEMCSVSALHLVMLHWAL